MNYFLQKINGLKERLRYLPFGIVYSTSDRFKIPRKLLLNGRFRKFRFSGSSTSAFVYEFKQICINDCYRLGMLKKYLKAVPNIVDIGANQGLFLVAARKHFSKARIQGYEPNHNLRDILTFNANSLDARAYFEAVLTEPGMIDLNITDSDLHTTINFSQGGQIPAVAFREVIERAGGQIDLLKIDCEGSEWILFEDEKSWDHVRSVTMEYHLWAKAGSSEQTVKGILDKLHFNILSINPISPSFGLITAVKKASGKVA